MAPSTPLLPGFPGTRGTDGPRDAATPRPGEHHALHDHRPGVDPGTVPHPARAVEGEPDPAFHGGRLRHRPESPPRPLEDRVPPGQPGPGPGPDSKRRPGNGDRGPPGFFTARILDRRGGPALPGRGDGLHPPTHAARVTGS